ncbi:MAG: hypothetical protein MUF07_07165 [Steroidobacteraceae bacterium]|jgi:hypothetical protein|nr:hypothetical protein [Steroidobacteraceae bacterium]
MNDSPVIVLAPLPAPFRRLSRRPWSLTVPMLLLAFAAGAGLPTPLRAGEAPSRVVPSPFVDGDPAKPCLVQIEEQGLARETAQLQAAVHACVKGRFSRLKAERPDLFPVEGKPQANRPK